MFCQSIKNLVPLSNNLCVATITSFGNALKIRYKALITTRLGLPVGVKSPNLFNLVNNAVKM